MYLTEKRIGMAGLLLAILLVGSACNKNESNNQSGSLVTIQQMLAKGSDGTLGTYCASDVVTVVNDVSTVIQDSGQVQIRNAPMNPDQSSSSAWMDVVINRYRVRYTRADGRNMEGEDVPWAYEESCTVTIPANGTAAFPFVLVRAVAKTELPLIRLAEGPIGEAQIISTATVDFYGHNLSGNSVTVTGTIGVHFANWADK